MKKILFVFALFLLCRGSVLAQFVSGWRQQESEHFLVIYRESHAPLVPQILADAENALATLTKLLHYSPSEKIVINTYDFSDYGSAGTTTVPHNFIRLEIEPFELGYETMPYNDRLQWILSHELVHVVMNDQSSKIEGITRKLFSKVPPEKSQPITVFYSLLTNFSRYTPRWHQEGIAVFFETWLSGGYGRTISNFDEMYFRALTLENKKFPSPLRLDGKDTHTSYLLEMLFYLYGVRFVTYLSATYGYEKVLDWFTVDKHEIYDNFAKKFKKIFGVSLNESWEKFNRFEEEFQKINLNRLRTAPLSPLQPLHNAPLGWVTQPFFDAKKNVVYFGNHRAHHLTAINELDLKTKRLKIIGSLPSPSLLQIASTAYDAQQRLYFFTTNNNLLYRDIWQLNIVTGKKKELFPDARVGQLTVGAETHELWGTQHAAGQVALVYAPYPYKNLIPTVQFDVGDDLQQLALNPAGTRLAAVLHTADGGQQLIVADCERLKKKDEFQYRVISADGVPEYPSWSADGKILFWNAYTNGVANIYRYNFKTERIEAISHTLVGLFRPVPVGGDSLFAFTFTSEGFLPVLIPNHPAQKLPAIRYLGQKVVEKNPVVTGWALQSARVQKENTPARERKYSGLSHVQIHSFIPILTGFQKQKVVGFYTHLADPLFVHDLTFELGYSPFNEYSVAPKTHFKGKYEYRREFKIGVNHNATDFYDLFNHRKRGMIGTKVTLGNTYYWKYDNPHKIKQNTEIAIYTGIEAINDNLVRVSRPDFFVFQSVLSSFNTRRSIGSTDKEAGSDWTATAMIFGFDPSNFQLVGGIHLEWDGYTTLRWPHNILHFKFAAGLRKTKDYLAIGKFYFGGFGNRYLENVNPKQFRKVFRLPGIPIYSLAGKRFVKMMFENNLPPLRLAWPLPGHHYINHIDMSWYSQGLLVESYWDKAWIDVGAQANMVLKHWYNLESTLSAGIAKAWSGSGSNWEWFVSYKILR